MKDGTVELGYNELGYNEFFDTTRKIATFVWFVYKGHGRYLGYNEIGYNKPKIDQNFIFSTRI